MTENNRIQTDAALRYAAIVAAFLNLPGVTQVTTRGFARGGLKIGGKPFATLRGNGDLVLKLPAHRVAWLSESGDGRRFDPGHGRVMKEWVTVRPDSAIDWLDLAREALAFVGSLKP